MSEAGDLTTTRPARTRRRVPTYRPISDSALAALRVIADTEEDGRQFPSLDELATAAGLKNRSGARLAVMILSDRRMIDGYGTTRRLTEAGWETLEAAGVAL